MSLDYSMDQCDYCSLTWGITASQPRQYKVVLSLISPDIEDLDKQLKAAEVA
jgi:hypothetical protein